VRFAVKSIRAEQGRPEALRLDLRAVSATPIAADGTSTLTWPATWDPDNAVADLQPVSQQLHDAPSTRPQPTPASGSCRR